MDASSCFSYSASLKLTELPICRASTAFPGVADLAVNSRSFTSYIECVKSAKRLMEAVVKDVNKQRRITGQQYTVSAEINPIYSGGAETRSQDWEKDELARFWIFDKIQEGAVSIHAVGQARVFAQEKVQSTLLLN